MLKLSEFSTPLPEGVHEVSLSGYSLTVIPEKKSKEDKVKAIKVTLSNKIKPSELLTEANKSGISDGVVYLNAEFIYKGALNISGRVSISSELLNKLPNNFKIESKPAESSLGVKYMRNTLVI